MLLSQNSLSALNSSCSQFSFIINSSKIRIVSLSIIDFEKFKAQIVEEYKSASKFITDAKGCFLEKNFGSESWNSPTINSPPSISGISPSLEYEPTSSKLLPVCQSSGSPEKVSKP